ncbi:glutathione S-transferase family protein [Comamonadaceae bacterium G21597-S1]|nr:glutathione S-transferase family protein [Comamonadaceae bacterium G21597-S1]
MRQLHYFPGNASMAPHILLEEIGAPFELVLVDRLNAGHKTPEYLQLNPNGLIPVYVDGALVLYEAAAICLHLSDSAPAARLLPPVGSPARAHGYKWLVWMTNTLQPALLTYFYPERWMNQGNIDGAAELKAHAQERVGVLLDQLDAELARHGGPWLLGADYSAIDAYSLMLCRWTRNFSSAPARERPHLGPHMKRVLERPAVQRVFATEQLVPTDI